MYLSMQCGNATLHLPPGCIADNHYILITKTVNKLSYSASDEIKMKFLLLLVPHTIP